MPFQPTSLTLYEGQRLFTCLAAQVRLAGQRQPAWTHCCRRARMATWSPHPEQPTLPSAQTTRRQVRYYAATRSAHSSSNEALLPRQPTLTLGRLGRADDVDIDSVSHSYAWADSLLKRVLQSPVVWLRGRMQDVSSSDDEEAVLRSIISDFYLAWTLVALSAQSRTTVKWNTRIATTLAWLGKEFGRKHRTKEARVQILVGERLHRVLDEVKGQMLHGDANITLSEARSMRAVYSCLRVIALGFERKENEAREALARLMGRLGSEWIRSVEQTKELQMNKSKRRTKVPVVHFLDQALARVLQLAMFRIYDVWEEKSLRERERRRKEEIAIETIDWLLGFPDLFRFNHFIFSTSNSRLNELLCMITKPVEFLSDRRDRLDSSELDLIASSICDALLDRSALALSYSFYKWAREEEITINENVLRKLVRLSSLAKENKMAERACEDAMKLATSSSEPEQIGVQLSTLRTVAMSCARRIDEAAMEEALSLVALHKHLGTKKQREDAFEFDARMLCYSRMGDIDKMTTMVCARYDLEASTKQEPRDTLLRPDYLVLERMAQTYLRAGKITHAEEMLQRMVQLGFTPATNILDHILSFYASRGDVNTTVSLFQQMVDAQIEPGIRTYTILMAMFAKRKAVEATSMLLQSMKKKGIQADRHVYTTLLSAHVEAANWQGAMDIFKFMLNHRRLEIRPTSTAYNVMLKAHVLRKSPVQDVFAFFRHMLSLGMEPDKYSFSLVMQSAADAGFMDLAEEVFSTLERTLGRRGGQEDGKGSNVWHFIIMIQGYLRVNQLDIARQYADELRNRGIPASGVLWGLLVKAYMAHDDGSRLESSHKLIQKAEFNDPQEYGKMYQPLIHAASKTADPEQIELLFQELSDKGTEIPLHFWVSLLDSFRREDNLEGAMETWSLVFDKALESVTEHDALAKANQLSVPGDGKALPSRRNLLCLPLSIMIDLWTRLGKFELVAQEWLRCRNSGFAFDSHNWNHLAVSLLKAGRIRDALNIIEKVLSATPPPAASPPTREDWPSKGESDDEEDKQSHEGMVRPEQIGMVENTGPTKDASAAEFAFSPSRPPNRRHENRRNDDPEAHFSLDENAPEEDSQESEVEDGEELEQTRRRQIDVNVLHYLEKQARRDEMDSPWFAHFETMLLLTDKIQEARRAGGLFVLEDGSQLVLAELIQQFPRVGELLSIFGTKLDLIEERARLDALHAPM